MADESPNGTGPTDADPLTPFERFERLAKEIITVPKTELDERRKRVKRRVRRTTTK
jgi:hypothetical protein